MTSNSWDFTSCIFGCGRIVARSSKPCFLVVLYDTWAPGGGDVRVSNKPDY